MRTTDIHALVHPDAPVIGYIGQGVEPKPRLTKRARTHPRQWRRLVLHAAVAVGDVADFYLQEEVGHAIRAGQPLLNEFHLPVNLLHEPAIRAARDDALARLPDQTVADDLAICAEQADAPGKVVRLPLVHPQWRLDVRTLRTADAPTGFRQVEAPAQQHVPLLEDSPDPSTEDLLSRFAVVTNADGLQAIADAAAIWATGQRARHNRDATAARFLREGVVDEGVADEGAAELRLPRRDVGAILDRHVDGAVARLTGLPGVQVGRKDSLVLTTDDPDDLTMLAELLIGMAVAIDRSDRRPVRQATTDHDTQQVLLRASQALVLADELSQSKRGRGPSQPDPTALP